MLKNYKKKYLKIGKLVYKLPTLEEIAKHEKEELKTIWEEVKRLNNPQKYYVDLSKKLYELKTSMLKS